MAHHVHQVGRIAAVADGEGGRQAQGLGVFAQQARADGVEGAGPLQRRAPRAGLGAERLVDDALDAPSHLRRGAARERQQQDAARIGAGQHQVRDPMRQRIGLARAGAGDDQQRRVAAVLHRGALLRVEPGQVGGDVIGFRGSEVGGGG
ncbi:hypothetical protein D3C72_1870590 [compost metagenome]